MMLEKTIWNDKKYEHRQWDSQIIFACFSPFASYFSMINHFFSSLLFWKFGSRRAGRDIRAGDLIMDVVVFYYWWGGGLVNNWDRSKFIENWFEKGSGSSGSILNYFYVRWIFYHCFNLRGGRRVLKETEEDFWAFLIKKIFLQKQLTRIFVVIFLTQNLRGE